VVTRSAIGVLALGLSALVTASALQGQQVAARAYLDRADVPVNQAFTLNLEVAGVRGLDGEPQFPDVEGFARYLGTNTSTSMQVINGRSSVTYTLQYRFLATVEGSHVIPPIQVRAGGQTLRTDPVSLTVGPAAAGAPSGRGQVDPTTGIAPGDLFILADVDKRTVYENEPIVVEYRIFTRVDVSSYSITSPPNTEGFFAEEIPLSDGPEVSEVMRDGLRYATAVIRRSVLFPTGPGLKTIEPLSIEAQVRLRRRASSLFDDFFGGSLLGSNTPLVVSSAPVEIDVKPLPAGKPANFTGLVGSLDVTASLDQREIDANEALSLTVRVAGEGNLRALPAPELDLPSDFEVFEPEVTEDISRSSTGVRGSKSYEYVLIPRAPGTREIPGLDLGYFDVGSERYVSARTPPITLEVTGEAPSLPGIGVRSSVETLREDIRFIRLGSPGLRPAGERVLGSPGFWIVALLPLVALSGALGLRRHQDRLAGDVAYARGRRAGRLARRRLAEARRRVGDDGNSFHAELAKALRGFLADKLNLAEAGMMTEQARSGLRSRGVPEDVVDELVTCLERCDRERFSPSPGGAQERADFLQRAEQAMTRVDRELR
jgi:hypothetical protein